MANTSILEINRLNTLLISAPSAERLSVPERLETMKFCTDSLQQAVLSEWQDPDDPHHEALMLKSAWLLAGVPTLVDLTLGQRPTYATAEAVHKNNQALADYLLVRNVAAEPSRWLLGTLSEFSISALLTWGVATRHVREGSYSLPAKPSQDCSKAEGLRNGFDLVFRTPRRRYPIQTKSSKPLTTSDRPYMPGITVVSPGELLEDPQSEFGAHDILDALVTDDQEVLGGAFAQLRAKLDATEVAVRLERQKRAPHVKIAV